MYFLVTSLLLGQQFEKVDSPISTKPLPKINWVEVPASRKSAREHTEWEKDISSRAVLGNWYLKYATDIYVHEATHVLVGRLSPRASQEGFYVGNGKGLVLDQPKKGTLLSGVPYIPSELHRLTRYKIYMQDQPRNQPTLNRPLYPLQELCCYNNGAESALQNKKNPTYKSDILIAPLEMALFCSAIAHDQKVNNSQEWKESAPLRLFLHHEFTRAVKNFVSAKSHPSYNWEDSTAKFFTSSPKCEHLRAVWKELDVSWEPLVDTPKK